MITKIDIAKFGLFCDYRWNQHIGNQPDDIFKRVNIIYGRNYSGKTTLSRIFRCIEEQKLHEKYSDGKFTLTNNDGSTSSDIALVSPSKIRVYNTDFVRENLHFLYDESGEIKPFTLLGSGNNTLQTRIDEIIQQLGSVESGQGLLFDKDKSGKALTEANKKLDTKEKDLSTKLTNKANREIKTNSDFIKQGTNYNITNIQHDIDTILKPSTSYSLTEFEKDSHKATINEQAKSDIIEISEAKPKFGERVTNTRVIIEKKISVTNTIQELVNDAILQSWVEKGKDLHKGVREKCAFCGSDITADRWREIDAHFSKESEDLKTKIAAETKLLEDSKSTLQTFLENKGIKKDNFYTAFHSKYDTVIAQWNSETKKYVDNIDTLLTALKKRDSEIFTTQTLENTDDNSEEILGIIKQFNELIRKHNAKTAQLETDKNNSREKLRLTEIKAFIINIDYKIKKKEIEDSKTKIAIDNNSLTELSHNISALELEKKEKEHLQKDEGTAALKVNELLCCFFGHDGLKLDPETVEEEGLPQTKFIIKRGEEKAHNLSEGECSLISFCYFIAKMDNELKGADSGKLIIYIDDPISSLDNNHIFFMFSLIEDAICKEKKYGQLFISTHNLEFLKYIKRLTIPNDISNIKSISHFSIVREQKCSDAKLSIKIMPKHLKENVTEYTFLFEQMYKIVCPISGDKARKIENTYTQFYNLANNMRKFLECYMYYRYPDIENPLGNLGRLFDNNTPTLVNRVINEGSHLTWGDRGTLPQDVIEAETVAIEILKAIKHRDQSHFDSLCESINVDKNIAL